MTNFATTSIMPLLARIVIASAMLTSGWVNCFDQIEIRPSMAEELTAMNIKVVSPVATPVVKEEAAEEADVVTSDSETEPKSKTIVATTRGVNRIVWLMHDKWPTLGGWGIFIAWTAAVSQLVAGILLFVGLFTRLAACVICIATGMAIYVIAGLMHGMFSMNPFDWPLDSHRFIQLFAGAGLFTLSLGLVFGGPGSLSIDAKHTKSTVTEEK
jgi:uncharacterized membrane protein YphA (DoxX/SURF4 family)